MASFVDYVNAYYLPNRKEMYLQGIVNMSLYRQKDITVRFSTEWDFHKAINIIRQGEMTGSNYFHSYDANADSWVEIQFNEEWVIPHTIVLADSGNKYRIRNWNFEASQNGIDYDILQSHTNDEIFQTEWQIEAFTIKKVKRKPYRFFRVQQTGLMSESSMSLRVGRLEVFGVVAFCTSQCPTPPLLPKERTCYHKTNYKGYAFIIFLLIK